tara:strand:+ start:128 stop:508 length:381 start_codon:yes stop_codon:yes gene_type:complete
LIIFDKLFTGIKPPEEIKVIDKLNASNVLRSISFKIKKIKKVNDVYKISILNDCFNVSIVSKDKKLVNVFLKLVSKISISKIIEDKKYKPPIHCEDDLHNIKLWSKCLILSNIVNPVEVKPDIDSK